MNKIVTLSAIVLFGFVADAMAVCGSPACKRIQSNPDVPDNIKQEIIDYYDRQDGLRKDYMDKQKQLRDALSAEAKNTIRTQGRKSLKKRKPRSSTMGAYQNNNNTSR